PRLLQHHVAAARPQGHLDRVGEEVEALGDRLPSRLREYDFLGCHFRSLSLFDDRQHVVLAEDQVLGPVDLDVTARILVEEDLVPRLDLQLAERPVLLELPGAHRDHQALLGLLLGGVRDEQAASRLGLFLDALDEDAVVKWPYLHVSFPPSLNRTRAKRPWSPWPREPPPWRAPSWSRLRRPLQGWSCSSCWNRGRCTSRRPSTGTRSG